MDVLYRTKYPLRLQTVGYHLLSMAMNDHFVSSFLRIHIGSRYEVREQKFSSGCTHNFISANLYTSTICVMIMTVHVYFSLVACHLIG